MSARFIDAAAAKALLDGTTPGPWTYAPPDNEDPAWITQDGDPCEDIAWFESVADADGRLCAAAPDLAASVITLEERVAGLVVEVERLRHERTEARAEVGRLTDDVDHLNTVYAASSAHVEEMVEALAASRAAIEKFLGVLNRLATSDDTGHAARAEYTEALEELRLAGGGAR